MALIFLNELKGQPNIIFLLADDQATISMGCYGNKDVVTPNLDRLSRKGFTFDNHYVTTAICMASRASILTVVMSISTVVILIKADLVRRT